MSSSTRDKPCNWLHRRLKLSDSFFFMSRNIYRNKVSGHLNQVNNHEYFSWVSFTIAGSTISSTPINLIVIIIASVFPSTVHPLIGESMVT